MTKRSTIKQISGWVAVAMLVAAGCADVADESGEDIVVRTEALAGDAALVPVADTALRNAAPNANNGSAKVLNVAFPPRARSVLRFDTAAIGAAAAGRAVTQAKLELTIDECGGGWPFGQRVSVHRVKSAWTEGGATWNCANDTNPSHPGLQCSNADKWKMVGSTAQLAYDAQQSASSGMFNGQQGKVVLDVTADVQAFLAGSKTNHGWLVKKLNEVPLGHVRFGSRESTNPPRLVLTFDEGGSAGTGGVGGGGAGVGGAGGTGGGPSCTPTAGNDVTCDGADDDCDGNVDEDFASSATSCGVGACAATGATSCVAGAVVDSCAAGEPSAGDVCDGVDNDCDGAVDEDFVPAATSCGAGACAAVGVTACVSGMVVDACTPGAPAATDTCDGVDNDCDGNVDEGFVSAPTTCGVGACAATGATSCVSGTVVNSCTAGTPAATDVCDGIDNDCDGSVDEGFTSSFTTCGVGMCVRSGILLCTAGMVVDTCTPGAPALNDASCNNQDNDCDGSVDEDYASIPTTCGDAACPASGSTSCVAGTVVNSCTWTGPCQADVGDSCVEQEDCATLGDSAMCLSEAMTGVPGGYCSVGCGEDPDACPSGSACFDGLCLLPCGEGGECAENQACFEFGGPGACVPVCTTDGDCATGSTCDTSIGFCVAPTCADDDWTCDGIDDDCDGNIDEDAGSVFGASLDCGAAACHVAGEMVCVDGTLTDNCGDIVDPSCTQETECGDGLDDDGDGFTDCFDPDCEMTAACLAVAQPVGGACSVPEDCRSVTGTATCIPAPGGYCSNDCSEFDPTSCPSNAVCAGGTCLRHCNPFDGETACTRPEHSCVLSEGIYVCM